MLSSLAPSRSSSILCCYVNSTAQVEIVRITNISHWYFERVVFPGQRILFKAPATARLEINTGMSISSIRTETIDCQHLKLSKQA
ncbi:MAG: DUF1830 domain-containing protein [Cyanobacteria bacterium J06621_8]